MGDPLKNYREDLRTANRGKILAALSNYEWNRYSDLLEKTGHARSTLSKYLDELVEKKLVLRKVDTESDEWPIPVLYKLGLGLPSWDTFNILRKHGLLEWYRKQMKEVKLENLPFWLAKFELEISLRYVRLCLELLEKKSSFDQTISETYIYTLNLVQKKVRRFFFEELQRRQKNGEKLSKVLKNFEMSSEEVDRLFKLAGLTGKESEPIINELMAYEQALLENSTDELIKQWEKIYSTKKGKEKYKVKFKR